MGERSDQIEEQIQRTREDLRDNLNELEQKVRRAFDWRTPFEERPLTMLAVAMGGGMLLAALLRRGGNRTAAANRIGRFLGQVLAGYGMRVMRK